MYSLTFLALCGLQAALVTHLQCKFLQVGLWKNPFLLPSSTIIIFWIPTLNLQHATFFNPLLLLWCHHLLNSLRSHIGLYLLLWHLYLSEQFGNLQGCRIATDGPLCKTEYIKPPKLKKESILECKKDICSSYRCCFMEVRSAYVLFSISSLEVADHKDLFMTLRGLEEVPCC